MAKRFYWTSSPNCLKKESTIARAKDVLNQKLSDGEQGFIAAIDTVKGELINVWLAAYKKNGDELLLVSKIKD